MVEGIQEEGAGTAGRKARRRSIAMQKGAFSLGRHNASRELLQSPRLAFQETGLNGVAGEVSRKQWVQETSRRDWMAQGLPQ